MKRLMFGLLLASLSFMARADCHSTDGQRYGEGEIVGNYICLDGKWVSR